MLFHVFYQLLGFILVAQGVQALQEPRMTWGVIPGPLQREPVKMAFWGSLLAGFGGVTMALGLLSLLVFPGLEGVLPMMQKGQFLVLALYGLWNLGFAGKVVYKGEPSAPAHHHH